MHNTCILYRRAGPGRFDYACTRTHACTQRMGEGAGVGGGGALTPEMLDAAGDGSGCQFGEGRELRFRCPLAESVGDGGGGTRQLPAVKVSHWMTVNRPGETSAGSANILQIEIFFFFFSL